MRRDDSLVKVEEVTERFNNMCTMVDDIMSSMARVAGYGGTGCCGEKSLGEVRLPRVVLGAGLKDIHGQR